MAKKKIKPIKLKKRVDQLNLPSKEKVRAVAVKYELKKSKAPKIIALGRGSIAEDILKLAEEHRVPLYEDKTLVNLLAKLEINDEIPPELYTLVAQILAFAYQLEAAAKKKKSSKNQSKK